MGKTEPWHRDKPLGSLCWRWYCRRNRNLNRATCFLRSLFHYQHCQRGFKIWKYEPLKYQATNNICQSPRCHGRWFNRLYPRTVRTLCKRAIADLLFLPGWLQPGAWRDSAAFINKGLSFAIHALALHLSSLPTRKSAWVKQTIWIAWNGWNQTWYFAFGTGYYLTPEQQESFGFSHSNTKRVLSMKNPRRILPITGFFLPIWEFWDLFQITFDFYNYGDPTHPYHHSQVEKTPDLAQLDIRRSNKGNMASIRGSANRCLGQLIQVLLTAAGMEVLKHGHRKTKPLWSYIKTTMTQTRT